MLDVVLCSLNASELNNVLVRDVVLIQDANQVRGNWKLGIVSQTDPKPREAVKNYHGQGYVNVQQPVHRLIVLVPADNKSEETNPVNDARMLD